MNDVLISNVGMKEEYAMWRAHKSCSTKWNKLTKEKMCWSW
jgi:hypothetical protein